MMQETHTVGLGSSLRGDLQSGQRLVALLALVGSKRLDVDALRERTKLTPAAFRNLLSWLQKEYLVDVVSNLSGDQIQEKVELTEKGEEVLIGLLEKTFELPELR